ncbi:MAG: hypothetical protein U0263_20675 [Polyangiaceae bacterium]
MTARAFLALVGLAALTACTVSSHSETLGCRSLADCDLGQACKVAEQRCVPVPENGVLGKFRCVVRAPGEKLESLPGSEVVGRVAGDDWAFPVGANCQLVPFTTELVALRVEMYTSASFAAFSVTVDSATALGQSVEIARARAFLVPNTASLWNPETSRAIAHSAGGVITFDTPPTAGTLVEGFVDVALHEVVKDDVLFGVPCPRGLADCGTRIGDEGGAELCDLVEFQNGDTHDVCTRSCESDADCAAASGICNLKECSRACSSNQECIAPLVCSPGDPGESMGCF